MRDSLRSKLRNEVMAASWSDLVGQFARGALLLASPTLDLLETATALASDDRVQVERWLSARMLWRATDEDAHAFQAAPGTRFQFVIVQPWVLAQPLGPPL